MQKIRIEPLQPKHIDEVYEISKEAFPLPWSKEELLKETYNETAVNLVSLIDDEVVGYLQCWYTFDEADLINIAVKSSHKREGIAHAMMIYLLEILGKKRLPIFFLRLGYPTSLHKSFMNLSALRLSTGESATISMAKTPSS